MKKYLLSFTAIVIAAGLSAFSYFPRQVENNEQALSDNYFFGVLPDMVSGNLSSQNTEFLEYNTDGTPPSYNCGGTQTNLCVIQITDPDLVEEVAPGIYEIKDPTSSYLVNERRP